MCLHLMEPHCPELLFLSPLAFKIIAFGCVADWSHLVKRSRHHLKRDCVQILENVIFLVQALGVTAKLNSQVSLFSSRVAVKFFVKVKYLEKARCLCRCFLRSSQILSPLLFMRYEQQTFLFRVHHLTRHKI